MAQGLKKGATLQGGTYQIEEVLGQGTFGITYLAQLGELSLCRNPRLQSGEG